jgi:hypothetical protein
VPDLPRRASPPILTIVGWAQTWLTADAPIGLCPHSGLLVFVPPRGYCASLDKGSATFDWGRDHRMLWSTPQPTTTCCGGMVPHTGCWSDRLMLPTTLSCDFHETHGRHGSHRIRVQIGVQAATPTIRRIRNSTGTESTEALPLAHDRYGTSDSCRAPRTPVLFAATSVAPGIQVWRR